MLYIARDEIIVEVDYKQEILQTDSLRVTFNFNDFFPSIQQEILDISLDQLVVKVDAQENLDNVQAVGQIAVVGSAIISTVVSGSLSQLWGLINGI